MLSNENQSLTKTNIKNGRRWYDKDPVLSKAMATLEKSDDKIQIQIALNLIKIVLEHQIEQEEVSSVDDIINTVTDASGYDESKKSRWYDLNETVRSAITMLQNCPEDLQKKISKDMAVLVSRVIQEKE